MQYAMLIYENEVVYGPDKMGEATAKIIAGHMAFGQELGAKRVAGAGLQNTPTATTVRTGKGGAKTLHDGPFAETREQLGGFYVIDAADLDEAIAIAKKIPIYSEGAVEIRPVLGQAPGNAA